MKSLEDFLFQNKLNLYSKEILLRLKWGVLFIIVVLSIFKVGLAFSDSYGYVIKKNLYLSSANKDCALDSAYFEARGILPIHANKAIATVLFGADSMRLKGFDMNNFDFLCIVIVLLMLHFYIKAVLKYGPFDDLALKHIKKIILAAFLFYLLKLWYLILARYLFEIDYPQHYHIDFDYYSNGNGWIYFAGIVAFVLNIFQYGRKLQEEQNLTI